MERKGLVCFCVVFITLYSQSAALPRDVVISKSDENVRNVYDNSKQTEKQVLQSQDDDVAKDGAALPQPQPTEQVIVKNDEDATKTDNSTELGKEAETHAPVNDFEPKARAFYIRVRCDFEEATPDVRCQEHCLPKGYTYGLCVQYTCSCV